MQQNITRTEFQEIAIELEEKLIMAQNQYPNNFADIYDKKAKAFVGFLVFIIIIAPGLFIPLDGINGLPQFYSFFGPAALFTILWSLGVNYSKKNNPQIQDNGIIKMVEGIRTAIDKIPAIIYMVAVLLGNKSVKNK